LAGHARVTAAATALYRATQQLSHCDTAQLSHCSTVTRNSLTIRYQAIENHWFLLALQQAEIWHVDC
jgi:hypothetical protein